MACWGSEGIAGGGQLMSCCRDQRYVIGCRGCAAAAGAVVAAGIDYYCPCCSFEDYY